MGQKVNPVSMRLGITNTWPNRWFAGKTHQYAQMVNADREIREFLMKKLKAAGIARVEIERSNKATFISLYTARSGVVLGRQGTQIEDLKKQLFRKFGMQFEIAVKEVKKPELVAKLVAENVASQLERRVTFRRASKMAVQKTMEAGAKGVKVQVGGRLGGADIARSEYFLEGKIPLHTFRADISYSEARANTTYGVIGVKVWIYKGDVFKKKKSVAVDSASQR